MPSNRNGNGGSSSTYNHAGSYGSGYDDSREAAQSQSREKRAEYARNHPGTTFTSRGSNPHGVIESA
ncbi:hypothetical protein CGCF413_v012175 [Colletotrichum fructicola]|nr:hypothetical protein CGCF413_v012175 [Colletotrichum fructicola]